MKICNHCGNVLSTFSDVCPDCGKPLSPLEEKRASESNLTASVLLPQANRPEIADVLTEQHPLAALIESSDGESRDGQTRRAPAAAISVFPPTGGRAVAVKLLGGTGQTTFRFGFAPVASDCMTFAFAVEPAEPVTIPAGTHMVSLHSSVEIARYAWADIRFSYQLGYFDSLADLGMFLHRLDQTDSTANNLDA